MFLVQGRYGFRGRLAHSYLSQIAGACALAGVSTIGEQKGYNKQAGNYFT